MCGICGFNWTDEQLIERMKDTLVHRGPDDQGSYVADGISLGHRRLSIVDLSEAGRQPLSNEDGTVWITFNGEIYNHRAAARAARAGKGHVFRSRTDTEAIVHAYEEYGLEFVEHLTGMFALAIWDAPAPAAGVGARSPGHEAALLHADGGRLRFASEIKALLADPLLPRARQQPGPVRSAGLRVHARAGRPCLTASASSCPAVCWSLEGEGTAAPAAATGRWRPRSRRLAERRSCDLLRARLRGSHYERCAAGRLSLRRHRLEHGGQLPEPNRCRTGLQTFALGYREASFSEFEYARRVAEHFHTRHTELLIRPVDARRDRALRVAPR